jgi:peptidoglycan/xylan/chitin deacetylase (PgdA/CDA1 family)
MEGGLLGRIWSMRREIAGAALQWSGAGSAFERLARPEGAAILMYHSIADPQAARFVEPRIHMSAKRFERQMAFLSRHRTVVPLSEVVESVAAGRSLPNRTVCITFDDGYLDNLTVAAPILQRLRLPAMLYLPTGYITRGEPQWGDRLNWIFGFRTSNELSLPRAALSEANLAISGERSAARSQIHARLLEAGYDEREELLGELEERLRPAGALPRLTMNWDDVRELRRRYPLFEVGGHSRDHIDLRKHRGVAARSQIRECASDLRRELGIEPEHFSFPYERWCAETRKEVEAAGWRSAVAAGTDYRIVAASDRFAMPRIECPRAMTGLRFKTSGAYPGALAMMGLA